MTAKSPRHWVLVKNAKTHGPFSTEQIQELLEKAEIEPTDRLLPYSPQNGPHDQGQHGNTHVGPETTVMDLIKSLSNDPTYKLFEALQYARDRESNRRMTATLHKTRRDLSRLKLMVMALIVAVGSLCLTVIYSLVQSSKAPDSAPTPTKSSTDHLGKYSPGRTAEHSPERNADRLKENSSPRGSHSPSSSPSSPGRRSRPQAEAQPQEKTSEKLQDQGQDKPQEREQEREQERPSEAPPEEDRNSDSDRFQSSQSTTPSITPSIPDAQDIPSGEPTASAPEDQNSSSQDNATPSSQ